MILNVWVYLPFVSLLFVMFDMFVVALLLLLAATYHRIWEGVMSSGMLMG